MKRSVLASKELIAEIVFRKTPAYRLLVVKRVDLISLDAYWNELSRKSMSLPRLVTVNTQGEWQKHYKVPSNWEQMIASFQSGQWLYVDSPLLYIQMVDIRVSLSGDVNTTLTDVNVHTANCFRLEWKEIEDL